jgi:thioredoxin 2
MNENSAQIVRCPNCQAANRVPADRIGLAAKCGKCQTELPADPAAAEPEASYKIRCTDCATKNRVPGGKLNAGAKCGKCGSQLKTEELFTPQPIMINDGNFEDLVLKSPLPVLMWAWAPW